MSTGWWSLVTALVVVTAYLAAVETVAGRLNVVRALRIVEDDVRGSAALLWLAEHRARTLDAVLVFGVVTRMGLAAAAIAAGLEFGGAAGAVTVLAVVAVVVLVVAEVAMRTLALRHLEPVGLAVAGSARLLVRTTSPLVRGCVLLGRSLVPHRGEVTGPHASDDELRRLDADDDEPNEELEPEERAMIRSIFELGDTHVREIMVPRPDMVTVPADAALDEVVAAVVDGGFSRLPVHDPADPDVVTGVVYAKDLLRSLADGGGAPRWDQLVRPPTFVPETKRVDELLRELQQGTVHLAFVVDEYGELVGLVTIEDILEEIVGEIVDEHDHEPPLVEPLDDGALRVDARLGVDDLNELLGAQLPEEGWDTVGGLVFATLGHVPEEGERIELDGVGITVEGVQGRRVGKVLVEVVTADDETETDRVSPAAGERRDEAIGRG